MAEFQEVIEGAKRMCWHYTQNGSHNGCPMYPACNVSQCRKIAFERSAEFEQRVMQWAAENPEPVYPTWEEWLVANGIMEPDDVRLNGGYRFYRNGKPVYNIPTPKMFDPIPDDIAQKLGIEPKEG